MVRILLSTRLGERKWTQADLSRMTGTVSYTHLTLPTTMFV